MIRAKSWEKPMPSRTKTTPPTTPPESVSPSALLHCEIHKQTKEIVLGRWADMEQPKFKGLVDLTFCSCCTGPAIHAGVSQMTLREVGGISPLCSRCTTAGSESAAGNGLGLSDA